LRAAVTLALLAVLLAGGCARKSQPEQGTSADSLRAQKPGASLSPRPESRMDSIALEGMEQSMRFILYDSRREGMSVPFTTYVPEDMAVRTAPRLSGDRFVVRAVFGGHVEPRAYFEARFLPPKASAADAHDSLVAWAPGERPSPLDSLADRRYPWSLEERWTERGTGDAALDGFAALAHHGDRYFVIHIEYPPEYGEGLLPRVERVLDNWRWEDTGGGLTE